MFSSIKGETMRIETTMSESIKNLATAQVKIQQEISDMPKDSEGYGYDYTSYDALVKYLRPCTHQESGFVVRCVHQL